MEPRTAKGSGRRYRQHNQDKGRVTVFNPQIVDPISKSYAWSALILSGLPNGSIGY
jgi:hypothetical protein